MVKGRPGAMLAIRMPAEEMARLQAIAQQRGTDVSKMARSVLAGQEFPLALFGPTSDMSLSQNPGTLKVTVYQRSNDPTVATYGNASVSHVTTTPAVGGRGRRFKFAALGSVMTFRDYFVLCVLLTLAWLIPLGVTIWFIGTAHAAPADPWLAADPVPVGLFSLPVEGWATTYGYRDYFQGRVMFCGAEYDADDPEIAAVGRQNLSLWPCGTILRLRGPAGSAVVIVADTGRMGPGVIDLSEAASVRVCGAPAHTCEITIERFEGVG